MRIVSLVPSITEALFDLAAPPHRIVGRTKFCIHPKDRVEEAQIIGGTKNLKIDEIFRLNPDLILANKEENLREQVDILQSRCTVFVTDVSTLTENNQLVGTLGKILNQEIAAQDFIDKINENLNFQKTALKPKVAYFIWQNPYMAAGGDTFISSMLETSGFENIFAHRERYPQIELHELIEADIVLLSSEPFPFRQRHVESLKMSIPNKPVFLVDGEAFSWYGTRPAHCGAYYRNLYHKLISLL